MPATRKTAKSSRSTRQRHALANDKKKSTSASKKSTGAKTSRWSHHVMETSDAMDIEGDIFKKGNAQEIAQSLKRSSEHSKRRKGTPFQSAMSMLTFYINRAGKNLSGSRRHILENAKIELRRAFGREEG